MLSITYRNLKNGSCEAVLQPSGYDFEIGQSLSPSLVLPVKYVRLILVGGVMLSMPVSLFASALEKEDMEGFASAIFDTSDRMSMRDFIKRSDRPLSVQQFIVPAGTDVRCIVVAGKFLCAMKRTNEGDFRSNIELGGHGEKYEPDDDMIAMCERAAAVLGLDYCGIDVLIGEDGKKYLCEVNSNAFFAEAERVCGVNIAKKFAELIISVQK